MWWSKETAKNVADVRPTLVCFLDKGYPPHHSFVTGMLAQALPEARGARVQLVVASSGGAPTQPVRYYKAAVLPVLPPIPRRGLARVLGMFRGYLVGRHLIARARKRGRRIVLFVRNDPAQLNVASVLRKHADWLVFQSSYPLDATHDSRVKRWLHRMAYKIGGRNADAVLAVSPLGLARARELVSAGVAGAFIPLLSDLPPGSPRFSRESGSSVGSVHFIYAGTHDPRRRLDVVLQGIVQALKQGADAHFTFIGGTEAQIEALRDSPEVRHWEDLGRIRFHPPVRRPELPQWLAEADVGLCLIPPLDFFKEASPTKLAEYLGAGLAVIASSGIELQEQFVQESGAGAVVPFEESAIAGALLRIEQERFALNRMKDAAGDYSKKHLRYEQYVETLKRLIEPGRGG